MRYFLMVATVFLVAIVLAPAAARADELYRIENPSGMPGFELVAYKGKVWLIKMKAGGAWRLETPGKRGGRIRVSSPDSDYHRWYLSFDPTGKIKEVLLTREPGPGSYWDVDQSGKRSAIRANAGKLKGWYLTAAKAQEKLKDAQGKAYVAYPAVLAKNPKPLPVFKLVELSR